MGLLQKTSSLNKPATERIATPLVSIQGILEEVPIPAYQFGIEIGTTIVALFQSVSGMSVKREVIPLTVGGLNNYTLEFPGHLSYGHLTLETGLTTCNFFWDWMMAGQYDGYAHSKLITLIQRKSGPNMDSYWEEARRWNFENAFPVSWKISDLGVGDSSKMVIETLELSFDYFLTQDVQPIPPKPVSSTSTPAAPTPGSNGSTP